MILYFQAVCACVPACVGVGCGGVFFIQRSAFPGHSLSCCDDFRPFILFKDIPSTFDFSLSC